MNENIASMICVALVIITVVSWIGFNALTSIKNTNEQNLKKLELTAEQTCALQPITNQTEFCRNFLKQSEVK